MRTRFNHFAAWVSDAVGSPWAFAAAALMVGVWLAGAALNDLWTDATYNFIINTTTTIITFLMVFAVQNTQNRDAKAMHAKMDELIRVNTKARDDLIGIEHPDKELPI
jgi:low affinity Fe/Cu permease